LSVSVVQEGEEEENIIQFLEAELADFRVLSVAEHQVIKKDDKPKKKRFNPKNPKVQRETNARVDELLQMGFIEHSKSPYSSPIVVVKKKRERGDCVSISGRSRTRTQCHK